MTVNLDPKPCVNGEIGPNQNSKRIWTIIRRKQAIDSIQNSSGKPNHQATDNWEIKLPDKGQLLNRLQCSGLRQLPKQV